MRTIIFLTAIFLGCAASASAQKPPVYKYYNATNPVLVSYGNTTLDICEIKALSAAGKFVAAEMIYSQGKNAFRNATAMPPIFRFLKRFATANYTGEQTHNLYTTFYGQNYFDNWLGGALNGTVGTIYTNAAVRKGSIDIFAQAYSFLYGLHEVDASFKGAFVDIKNISRGEAEDLLREAEDGYAVYAGSPKSECTTFKFIKSINTCLPSKLTPANDIINGFNAIQKAGKGLLANTTSLAQAFAAAQNGRNSIVTGVWRTYVAATLDLLVKSDKIKAKSLEYRAGALAAFKIAAPITNVVNPVATKDVLSSLEALVKKPTTKEAAKMIYSKIEKLFKAKKIDVKSYVYSCKV